MTPVRTVWFRSLIAALLAVICLSNGASAKASTVGGENRLLIPEYGASPNHHNTINGLAPTDLYNLDLELDGTDDFASASDSSTLDLGTGAADDFTIETFFYVPDLTNTTTDTLVWKQASYGLYILYSTTVADRFIYRIHVDPTNYVYLYYNVDLSVGWHHVAAVFDNEFTASQDLMALYFDGSLADSSTATEWTPGILNSSSALNIGAYTGINPLDGWMEETRFSNVVRYGGATYTVPTVPFTTDGSTNSLWRFDDGWGATTFTDSSGNGNTLTGQNGAKVGNPSGMPPTPAAFNKSAPGDGVTNQPISPILLWEPSAGAASYEYCYDTTNDGACGTIWVSTSDNTTATLLGLNESTTYYWQIRAINLEGVTTANNGNWWSFTTTSMDEVPGDLFNRTLFLPYEYAPNYAYAEAPDNNSLDLGAGETDDFTIDVYFYLINPDAPVNYPIIYKDSAYALRIDTQPSVPDVIYFIIWTGSETVYQPHYEINLSPGWHHLAAVFDNEYTSSLDMMEIYLDGIRVLSFADNDWVSGIPNSTSPIRIGRDSYSDGDRSVGWLEEIRLSSNVRYSGPTYTIPLVEFPSDSDTQALWHFDEAMKATTFYDDSGNGNTLTGYNHAQIGNPYPKFEKSLPENHSINQPITSTLSWTESSGVLAYEYCIDTTNDNSCAWVQIGTTPSVALSGLSKNTTYYWHVRAINSLGITYSNNSENEFWSFTTVPDAPAPYNKSAPVDGVTNQSTSPTLFWDTSTGAASYEYCYDTTNDSACDGTWISTGTNTFIGLTGLSTNTTYYWQTRAVNTGGMTEANGGTWWSFTTIPNTPVAFNKSAPANGAIDQALSPTLAWNPSTGAASYEYCYDTTNDSACDGSWISTATNTSIGLSGLSTNTSYYWQARSVNAGGTTYADSGTWWSFTTITNIPEAFSKSAPVDGAIDQAASPSLSWNPSSGATSYEYCYDASDNSSCDSSWVSTGTSLSVVLSGLSSHANYYWQVRAINAAGNTYANNGTWWTFTTVRVATGTTSRGWPMSFHLPNLSTQWANFKLKTDFVATTCYNTSGTIEVTVPGPGAITNNQFSYTSATYSFAGTFSSLTNASGTYSFTNRLIVIPLPFPPYTCNYYLTQSGTWNSTAPLPSPEGFAKSSPIDGAGNQSIGPTLSWTSSVYAESYEYCVDTVGNNTCDTSWNSTGASTSIGLTGLANNTTYYWQARAANSGGTIEADTGTWWTFATAQAAPGAFSKSGPLNGETGLSTSPTLTWDSSSGAASYEYCYDTTNDSACDGSWIPNGTSTSVGLSGLSSSTTYHWQARAINPGGVTYANGGTWWSFTTLYIDPAQIGPTFTVNSTDPTDDGVCGTSNCTLREAINAANADGTISTIELTPNEHYIFTTVDNDGSGGYGVNGLPLIDTEITINGHNATIERSTAEGIPVFRLIQVLWTGKLTLNDLTFTGGSGHGGGVISSWGKLYISNCTFHNNFADNGGGAIDIGSATSRLHIVNSDFHDNTSLWLGGAVKVDVEVADALIENVSFTNNHSSSGGGAIYTGSPLKIASVTIANNSTESYGGAIYSDSNLTLSNSTIYGNQALATAGGLFNNNGPATIINSTFSNNGADFGGNIGIYGGTVFVSNSIIANSSAGANCYGSITDGGHNLDTGSSCGFSPMNESLNNTDPYLGVLQDNGGTTLTMALLPFSPAIDAGNNAVCAVEPINNLDQRGNVRPVDGDKDSSATCDIGAFESAPWAQPGLFTKTSPPDAAVDQPITPTLSWSASADAVSYEYCHDTNDNDTCDGSWASTGTNTSVVLNGLSGAATYYWQIRALNAGGTTNANRGIWWSFTTVNTPPEAFGKISPLNGAVDQPTSILLSWQTSAGADSYEYCFDTTNDGSCVVWSSNGNSTTKAISGLASATTYYWHIRAVNEAGTTYSDGNVGAFWSFTTLPNLPAEFDKTSPLNGALAQPTSLTLSWNSSANAAFYQYCYDTTNDDTCSSWLDNGASTSKALSGLAPGTTYYWQVRADNVVGRTYANASTWWSFTTVSSNPVFVDVPADYWARQFIERLYNASVTGGCSLVPLMYCPETIVNRAQMAVFLLRGEHGSAYVPPDVGTGTGFTDVPDDYWAAAWIKQLAAEGITSGCGPSLYCPETPVTRDQMAVFLLRAEHGASYTPPPATGVFTDVPTTHWAASWIEQLAAEGITGGCGVGTYCPTTPVTRAQMAVFLVRAFNLP